ncbi:AAA domain-containing protein [Schwartzia succinivorans DSM 10502]|jgi:hypothetical protein|uniref:AAA domain-containing protein n=1 Tax=Schwartzia succinivorans DSM 10502 TaxID=1123243 RepID=A0A1M4YA51_9FIRM|nr:AAA domain-containing protein [Schwartzia succinivorans DSM 10502]
MIFFSGHELKSYLDDSKSKQFSEKRDIYDDINKHIHDKTAYHIAALYGLRRTGKSALMEQLIRCNQDYDYTALIVCSKKDSIDDLYDVLDKNKCIKFFYIDEITRMDDFFEGCNVLADVYANKGKKIVIAGANSLELRLAQGHGLHDKIELFHTTYIPFGEYQRILNGTIDDYIESGGTLTDGEVFESFEKCTEYINAAITDNMLHGLMQLYKQRELSFALGELLCNDQAETYVNKFIESYNRKFAEEIIDGKFDFRDVFNASDCMWSNRKNDRIAEELQKLLIEMDVIYPAADEGEMIFLQPGMRYAQLKWIFNSLRKTKAWKEIPHDEKAAVEKQLKHKSKKKMLDDILYLESLMKVNKQNADG